MKTILAFIAIASLLLTGCPFRSDVPITEPSGPLDARLLGIWVAGSADGGGVLLIRFMPLSDSEYLVETLDYPADRRYLYRAYAVTIGDRTFLQFREFGDADEPGWYLARCDISKTEVLTLQLVDGAGVPAALASDARGLSDFVAAHLNDGVLWGDEEPVDLVRVNRSRASN